MLSFSAAQLLLFAALNGTSAQTGRAAEPTYVVFQFQGMEDENPRSEALPGLVAEIRKTFGAQPAGSARYVGFTPGLLYSLNLPKDVLRSRVEQALDLAANTGIPVFFHLDDMHFWWKRTDLNRDPMNVEWSAFPKPGEPHGPIIERYWLNWGDWIVFPAPPPNFESHRFRADVANRLKSAVAAPIARALQRWRKEGREYLFAGIAIGNETETPVDLRPLRGAPDGQGPDGLDTTHMPPTSVRMRPEEMVRGGYAALWTRGWTTAKVREAARKRGISEEQLITELRHQVAHDYAEFRARTLVEAGIPANRVYTHFISPFLPFAQRQGDAAMAERVPPARYSVNPWCRPGYTVVREQVDLPDLRAQIRRARDGASTKGRLKGDYGWGAVETYATVGQPGRPQTQEEYEAWLGGVFGYGARVVNLYGWNIPDEAQGVSAHFAVRRAPGVVAAIRAWVAGKQMPATWKGSDPAKAPPNVGSAIPRKMQRLQELVRRAQQQGRDPSPVGRLMEGFEPLIRAGRLPEAEALLDRALEEASRLAGP